MSYIMYDKPPLITNAPKPPDPFKIVLVERSFLAEIAAKKNRTNCDAG
jgi:hypothetical protein